MLGVVARVTKDGVDPDEPRCLAHCGREVGRVLARADARHRAEDEVRVGVDERGEFRPGPLPMALAPAPQPEVGADVPRLEAGRIHGRDGSSVDQAAAAGAPDHRGLSSAEGPPASASARMRREAWARVE